MNVQNCQVSQVQNYNKSEIITNDSNRKMKTKDKLVVGFVWGIIVFETTCFLTIMVPLLYENNPLAFVIIVPFFLTVVSLLFVSYYKSTTCPPGSPSTHINTLYSDEIEEIKEKSKVETEKKKQRRKMRVVKLVDQQEINSLSMILYCFKCEVVKEQRVHHCSICKRCIMRMDHHCPWVGNCVGKLNHKYFILFLLYATTGLLIVSCFVGFDLMNGSFYAHQIKNKNEFYLFYFSGLSSFMLTCSIGFLLITQLLTAFRNLTTLESFIEGIYQQNPFKKNNWKQNLREIFGSSNWLLPTKPFGHHSLFETNQLNSVDSL